MVRNRICDIFHQSKRIGVRNFTLFVLLGCLASTVSCVEKYDFIIVGGGTGGLAVARRLAEDGKYSVLVLESGGLPKEGMDIPVNAHEFSSDPDVVFRYPSTRQSNSGLRYDGVHTLISGRVLGGTSNLNYMAFNRGNPRDYDNWGNLTQDSSWNYSNMLKYFKRVETYEGDFPSDQHGYSGPITLSRPQYAPGLEHWLSAGRYLGYLIADPNGPQQTSFTPIEFAKRYGRRVDSFTGYIKPILSSASNLKIILNTNVTNIIFNGKQAVGVRFQSTSPELQENQDNCLYANKEIIVSAGAYSSPLILMRSGIGPRNMLSASGIPLVQDLPAVGLNLRDHISVPIHITINNRSESTVLDTDRDLNPQTWEYYNKFGDGPYSSNAGSTGQAFVVSSYAKSNGEADWPDINIQMSHSVQPFWGSSLLGDDDNPNEVTITPHVAVSRPKSTGYIELNPRDPFGSPFIDVNFLSDPRDVDVLLEGIKLTIKIHEETPSYKELGARVPYVDIPMCRKFRFRSDDYWRCYIRYASVPYTRAAGSCRMGNGDSNSVVDSKLRVIGVKGLRVIDASIMPVETNSNIHAVVYAIAEKGADMILENWERL